MTSPLKPLWPNAPSGELEQLQELQRQLHRASAEQLSEVYARVGSILQRHARPVFQDLPVAEALTPAAPKLPLQH